MPSLNINTLGQGTELVFLHGWGTHSGIFSQLATQLAGHYRLHLVDLPGHGASASCTPYDGNTLATLLNQHITRPIHLIAWSLGGLVAQYWAYLYPDKIKSLCLIASSPCFARRHDWPHAANAHAIKQITTRLQVNLTATLDHFLRLQAMGSAKALSALHEHYHRHRNLDSLLVALPLLLTADTRSFIPKLNCPVSLFFGQHDVFTPIGVAYWFAQQLPWANLFTFKHAAHVPFLSHEKDFIIALKQHLTHKLYGQRFST